MKDVIKLPSRINSRNNQINFQLKRSDLPKKMKEKLPKLKGIKIDIDSFEFDEL